MMCAAGVLIPNELYDPLLEGQIVEESSKVGKIVSSAGHNINLVRRLQSIHHYQDEDGWEEKFEEVARKWNLKYSA